MHHNIRRGQTTQENIPQDKKKHETILDKTRQTKTIQYNNMRDIQDKTRQSKSISNGAIQGKNKQDNK